MAANSSSSAKPSKTEQSLFVEDDEFEEFPTEGKRPIVAMEASLLGLPDWLRDAGRQARLAGLAACISHIGTCMYHVTFWKP